MMSWNGKTPLKFSDLWINWNYSFDCKNWFEMELPFRQLQIKIHYTVTKIWEGLLDFLKMVQKWKKCPRFCNLLKKGNYDMNSTTTNFSLSAEIGLNWNSVQAASEKSLQHRCQNARGLRKQCLLLKKIAFSNRRFLPHSLRPFTQVSKFLKGK